ncbi:LacI family DNA-binding transcriptional regulator [Microbacterium sp. X-17]|uniref:LacI family DNA-binding transcriptional regulator n=1 Tax=Microbacterium sp. X-17 TaxID=3144404 RepID=UPI0031F49D36
MSTPPPPPPRKRVTAAMVAERAGTSIAAVSLVVNGKQAGRISDENAERVRAAVRELGYVVDSTASALARGTSDVVVLLAPDLPNPFFGRVINAVQETLGPRFQLLLFASPTGEQPTVADVQRLAALRPAGLLVSAPTVEFLDDAPAGVPLVLLDAPGLQERAPTVNYDLASGVRALIAHLAERGHTTIGYLDGSTPAATYELRRTLLQAEAERRGMTLLTTPPVRSRPDIAEAMAATEAALPGWRAAGATAVIAASDTLAHGVLAACARAGLRVPEDIAVAGFDDLPASSVTAPALTSVALPGDLLGSVAARLLLSLIDGGEAPANEELPAELVARASTG